MQFFYPTGLVFTMAECIHHRYANGVSRYIWIDSDGKAVMSMWNNLGKVDA